MQIVGPPFKLMGWGGRRSIKTPPPQSTRCKAWTALHGWI